MSTYDMDELEAISDSTKSNNPNAARIAEKMMAKRQAARKRALGLLRGPDLHHTHDL